MDTLEMITMIRNIVKKSEHELPTMEILRYLNIANSILINYLGKLIEKHLYGELIYEDVSGNIVLPEDMLDIITLYRHDGDKYRKCYYVNIANKSLIGTDPNYPDNDSLHPLYVRNGNIVNIYPAPSSNNVKLEYMRMTPELIIGRGASAGNGSYLTLDEIAPPINNILNGYYLNVYNKDNYKLDSVLITYYDGLNKFAYGDFPSNQNLIYAMVPLIPNEFHWFMIEFSMAFLALSGKYQADGMAMKGNAFNDLMNVLKIRGILQ